MNLLVVTQAVDQDDPVLGFFHRWIEELSERFAHVEVICLREGRHSLPENVVAHSLKKGSHSRISYALRFLSLVFKRRDAYDAVFVHMNQEYVLLGGWLFALLGKPIYLWRNHYHGSWLTDIAIFFSKKLFVTSMHAYGARSSKAVCMPVGVDLARFFPDARVKRSPRSILFLGRMAPSKRPEMLIDALEELSKRNVGYTASFVGSPKENDLIYYENLVENVKARGLKVNFFPGVPKEKTPELFRSHAIFVNTSPSGMLDKTIFEAGACGCVVLTSSKDVASETGDKAYFSDSRELASKLEDVLGSEAKQKAILATMDGMIERNGLNVLMDSLAVSIQTR